MRQTLRVLLHVRLLVFLRVLLRVLLRVSSCVLLHVVTHVLPHVLLHTQLHAQLRAQLHAQLHVPSHALYPSRPPIHSSALPPRGRCGDYIPNDCELRQFIVGLKKERNMEMDSGDDKWGTIYISQRLKDYEAHFGRYPTARPTSKEMEGKAEYEGDFLLFPGGGYRWVGKDEQIQNPMAAPPGAAPGGARDDGRGGGGGGM